MTKGIPEKCKKCAMLSADQAQELHGNDGDRCWNPAVCYSRRSYAGSPKKERTHTEVKNRCNDE